MKHKGLIFFYLLLYAIIIFGSCKGEKSSTKIEDILSINIYSREPMRILNNDQTLRKIKEIKVTPGTDGAEEIIINAFNGRRATFFSFNPCGGVSGPHYTIIGSIPTLGWVFVDRSYGCHGGETLIAISLIDGSQHELMVSGIFDSNQLQMSPKNNWLVISSCDCSMEYTCGMEIISLKNESESEFKSVYYNQRMCSCNSITWTSEIEFTTNYAIEGNDFDCNYKNVNFSFKNNQWNILD